MSLQEKEVEEDEEQSPRVRRGTLIRSERVSGFENTKHVVAVLTGILSMSLHVHSEK
jgi:hypothetical protein